MPGIFISYSRKDEDFARRLALDLKALGVEIWIDQEDIRGGVSWADAIDQGLKTSDLMILIVSPDSMASENVRDEWQFFRNVRKHPILPVWYRPADMHFQLAMLNYVDFHAREYDPAFEALCTELRQNGIQLAERENAPEAPRAQIARPALPSVSDLLPPPFEWVDIPAGQITLEISKSGVMPPGPRPQHFDVAAFKLAKYPITNAQFQVFVDAENGYRDAGWWAFSDHAIAWRAENAQPQDTGFEGDDLPRTRVAWYEAMAFCRWLGAQTGEDITLPTEQQWQRAAQGDDGRTYPWGSAEPNEWLCNFDMNVGQPTPVIRYPDGASPYGVLDMAGNVWEWCLNQYDDPHSVNLAGGVARVLRGGAFSNYLNLAQSDYRYWDHPLNGFGDVGFRIVHLSSQD